MRGAGDFDPPDPAQDDVSETEPSAGYGPAGGADDRAAALAAARALERWGTEREWAGPDPYDALNATRLVAPLRGRPLGRRLLTQLVKRSPLDLRPFLGIPPARSAATLAHVVRAYARNGFLGESEAEAKLKEATRALADMRASGFDEPCWGYHFDVQTRAFFYARTVPNTIATAFAGLGLLEAHERTADALTLELASGAADFFLRHVPQTDTGDGAYFGYLPGDRTPIHNASMLVAALLARLGSRTDRDDCRTAADRAVRYTIGRQRANGSWPYGETAGLDWVDGFHTGYVLDCLLACEEAGVGGTAAREAWRRGVAFYASELVTEEGAPKYTPTTLYPVDGQCAAQAIQTLALGGRRHDWLLDRAWQVFSYTMRKLARGDGAFVFQRRRLWVNRIAHPRWVQAPMLAALAELLQEPVP